MGNDGHVLVELAHGRGRDLAHSCRREKNASMKTQFFRSFAPNHEFDSESSAISKMSEQTEQRKEVGTAASYVLKV